LNTTAAFTGEPFRDNLKRPMMGNFLLRVVANGVGLYAATMLVTGFAVQGGFNEFALAALVLAILNMFVKPLLKLVSFPLIIITLGLFTIVINALILWLVTYVFSFVIVSGWLALLLASLVIAAANTLVTHNS
ncbi:MAG: phage holin family protein, partial [Patescibacteria group bacterium]